MRSQPDLHPTEETRQLEGFFLCREPEKTLESELETIAEIVGVIIGLKPASLHTLELSPTALRNLQTIIADLRLFSLVERFTATSSNRALYDIFISKTAHTAQELRNTLRSWQALGFCPDSPKDQELSLKLGRLLGYPKTATEHVTFGPRTPEGTPCFHPGSDRDRYYIHSPDHYIDEYRHFEDILHPALTKLCPTTAQIMRQNTSLNWSSRNFRTRR